MQPQIQFSHQQIHNHNHSYFHEAIGGAAAAAAAAAGSEPWRVAADGSGAIHLWAVHEVWLLRRRSPVVLPQLAAAAGTVAAAGRGGLHRQPWRNAWEQSAPSKFACPPSWRPGPPASCVWRGRRGVAGPWGKSRSGATTPSSPDSNSAALLWRGCRCTAWCRRMTDDLVVLRLCFLALLNKIGVKSAIE